MENVYKFRNSTIIDFYFKVNEEKLYKKQFDMQVDKIKSYLFLRYKMLNAECFVETGTVEDDFFKNKITVRISFANITYLNL
jgi:hypothetical protein